MDAAVRTYTVARRVGDMVTDCASALSIQLDSVSVAVHNTGIPYLTSVNLIARLIKCIRGAAAKDDAIATNVPDLTADDAATARTRK